LSPQPQPGLVSSVGVDVVLVVELVVDEVDDVVLEVLEVLDVVLDDVLDVLDVVLEDVLEVLDAVLEVLDVLDVVDPVLDVLDVVLEVPVVPEVVDSCSTCAGEAFANPAPTVEAATKLATISAPRIAGRASFVSRPRELRGVRPLGRRIVAPWYPGFQRLNLLLQQLRTGRRGRVLHELEQRCPDAVTAGSLQQSRSVKAAVGEEKALRRGRRRAVHRRRVVGKPDVVLSRDEQRRGTQLPRGGDGVERRELARARDADHARRRRAQRCACDDRRSPAHRRACEEDRRAARRAEVLRGAEHVAVDAPAARSGGRRRGPAAAEVDVENAEAARGEHARERQPVAEVGVQLVTEDDADPAFAEDDADDLHVVARPERDDAGVIRRPHAVLAQRRSGCVRGGRARDKRDGQRGRDLHVGVTSDGSSRHSFGR
jgi:hypothetical protein